MIPLTVLSATAAAMLAPTEPTVSAGHTVWSHTRTSATPAAAGDRRWRCERPAGAEVAHRFGTPHATVDHADQCIGAVRNTLDTDPSADGPSTACRATPAIEATTSRTTARPTSSSRSMQHAAMASRSAAQGRGDGGDLWSRRVMTPFLTPAGTSPRAPSSRSPPLPPSAPSPQSVFSPSPLICALPAASHARHHAGSGAERRSRGSVRRRTTSALAACAALCTTSHQRAVGKASAVTTRHARAPCAALAGSEAMEPAASSNADRSERDRASCSAVSAPAQALESTESAAAPIQRSCDSA